MASDVKPSTTFREQVDIFSSRGLVISDRQECENFLKQTTYYRLSAYLLPFKTEKGNYTQGVTFERLKNIFEFDQKMRAILFQAIENIELYLRSQFSYYCATNYGPLCYRDKEIFDEKQGGYARFQEDWKKSISMHSKNPIILHHKDKYDGNLPIWVLIDFLSIRSLYYFYKDLRIDIRKDIAEEAYPRNLYNTWEEGLSSWLKCLVDLRNRCAHFSRLYYWNFPSLPQLPRGVALNRNRKLFTQIMTVKFTYPPDQAWTTQVENKIEGLTEEYQNDIVFDHVGFPSDWKELLTLPI